MGFMSHIPYSHNGEYIYFSDKYHSTTKVSGVVG